MQCSTFLIFQPKMYRMEQMKILTSKYPAGERRLYSTLNPGSMLISVLP